MKYLAEISESLVWSVYLDVPDEIVAEGEVAIRDFIYENWGECEKDICGGDDTEIVRLEPKP